MMGVGTFGGGGATFRGICWLFIIISCMFTASLSASEGGSTTVSKAVQAAPDASASATAEAQGSESEESSPEVSIGFLDSGTGFPEPEKQQEAVASGGTKIELPEKPKFQGEIEEVSEGAGISPFEKSVGDGSGLQRFEKMQDGPFIYHMPLDAEKAKLRDIKKLKYTVEPEVSFTEYEIGKDLAKDSELYYTLKEKVASEKKVLSEVLKVVKDAEEYRQNIDSTIRGLVMTVNQIKDSISQNEEQLNNMKKAGTVPNVSIVAQEDELSRLKLKYQDSYGHLMSEKRKRDGAINLSLKAKQQQLNIEERIKRTEDKIRLLEAQLEIHEDSSVPLEALEILKEPEVEIKQEYIPDEYSLAQRRSDVDITPGSYDASHGLEAEESTGVPEESPIVSPRERRVSSPEISPIKSAKLQELGTLSVSDLTAGSAQTVGLPKEVSGKQETVVGEFGTSSVEGLASPKQAPKLPLFNVEKYLRSALSEFGVSNSDSLFSTSVKDISEKINIINFAMSCIYEVDFYFKVLNTRSGTNLSSSDAMKICRQVWRESFNDMVKYYGTVTPATLRAIFKSSIQSDQEASSTLANYYVEEQFAAMVTHIKVGSLNSCINVVSQLFKSADFQESLIHLICVNFEKYYNLYSQMISDKSQLMLLASKLAIFSSAPYSYDSAPFSNTSDLDQMLMEFDYHSLTTSSMFYEQCLSVYSKNYGPGSLYGLSNNAVQSVCTSAQNAFNNALPHGVNVVIFSTKQLSLELIPLLSGARNISFYGQSILSQSAETLLPKDVSVSSKDSTSNLLAPQSVSELSPTLQLSLHTLDEQSKIQKFLEEQQKTIQSILENPLAGIDLHRMVSVLKDINERQKSVEVGIMNASPISEIQTALVSLGGQPNIVLSQGAEGLSESKPGEIGIESSLEVTIAGFFLDRIASQQDSLSSQISQLEAVLRSPTLTNEDRALTEEMLKDTENRKVELSRKYDEAVSSLSPLAGSITDASRLSAGLSSSLSPSISVSTSSSKFAFERSVGDLKSIYAEVLDSNRDAQTLSESLYSTSISDSSLKNELDSLSKKIQKISIKLAKIEKKLQQPNLSFKSKSDLDDLRRILQKLLHASRQNIDKLKSVERSNTSSISQQEFASSFKPSHSLSPIMTQSAMSSVLLPSSTSRISSLLVKIQHIQSEISKFLSLLKIRKLQKQERRSLKKLFSEVDPRLSLLLKLVLKEVSGFNQKQLSEFSQRYLDQLQAVYVVERELLKEYLVLSKRSDTSPDGIKIHSLVKEISNKQAQIVASLTAGRADTGDISSSVSPSSAGRSVVSPGLSTTPGGDDSILGKLEEPEFIGSKAPGFNKQKLVLPAIPLFRSPVVRTPSINYSNVRKDERGVPIVSGPVAGSKVGEVALNYIEKALKRQKTSGIYPEGFEIVGSTAHKPVKQRPRLETSITTKPGGRDTFCTRHGYSTMSPLSNNIAYRLYLKGPRILPRSSVTTLDRRTVCNIASLLQGIKLVKECSKVLYPTLLRLGFSVSQNRTEKVCYAIGIVGKEVTCSSFTSFRSKKPYKFQQIENERSYSLFSSFSKLQSSGVLPRIPLFTHHLVCHIIESMIGALEKGERFTSFKAYECASAFEQQASNDGNPLTTRQVSAIMKACESAGFLGS